MQVLKKDINIYYRIWDQVKEAKAILQIFHGMVEHIERYDDFARFLNDKGIIVYGMDVRGHGRTGLENGLGCFCNKDGWKKVLEDQKDLRDFMIEEYPDLPRILLGHSMGSFFARTYINTFPDDFDAAIIMGTGKTDDPSYALLRLMLRFFNPMKPAKLINSLAFGGFNKYFKDAKTDYDWLSRDQDQVKKYIEDPLCGFLVKNSFYKDFADGMSLITQLEEKSNQDIKILFISGQKDPVGAMGQHVLEAAKKYPQADVKIYKDMRHEILNEISNQQVYDYLAIWIEKTKNNNRLTLFAYS